MSNYEQLFPSLFYFLSVPVSYFLRKLSPHCATNFNDTRAVSKFVSLCYLEGTT